MDIVSVHNRERISKKVQSLMFDSMIKLNKMT